MGSIGKMLVAGGMVLVVVGLILWLGGNRLGWLGKLPGDIRIERDNFSFYFPITTMILVSVILSFIMFLINRLR